MKGGKLHGPYWYLYYYRGNRLVSKYIGKRLDYTIHCKQKKVPGVDPNQLEFRL